MNLFSARAIQKYIKTSVVALIAACMFCSCAAKLPPIDPDPRPVYKSIEAMISAVRAEMEKVPITPSTEEVIAKEKEYMQYCGIQPLPEEPGKHVLIVNQELHPSAAGHGTATVAIANVISGAVSGKDIPTLSELSFLSGRMRIWRQTKGRIPYDYEYEIGSAMPFFNEGDRRKRIISISAVWNEGIYLDIMMPAFDKSSSVIVEAAGNEGISSTRYQQAHNFYLSNLFLRIGVVEEDGQTVEKYSNYGSISFVAPNGFDHIPNMVPQDWQAPDFLSYKGTDFYLNIDGTSFAAPVVSGIIAGQMELHPELTEEDFVAGALLAAFRNKPALKDDQYLVKDNGAGFQYDCGQSGFGLFLPSSYAQVMAEMSDIASAEGLKPTEKVIVHSNPGDISKVSDNTYSVDIPDSEGTAIRTHFVMSFDWGECQNIPSMVTLVSPTGSEIEANLMFFRDMESNQKKCLATTDGFFGNQIGGQWQVKFPEGVVLRALDIKVSGATGPLIDIMIAEELKRHQTGMISNGLTQGGPSSDERAIADLTAITPENAHPDILKKLAAGADRINGDTNVQNTP